MSGGVFTSIVDSTNYVLLREKDTPSVLEPEVNLGFMGSDNFGELPIEQRRTINFKTVSDVPTRFALACLSENLPSIEDKIKNREPLMIATSFPNATKKMEAEVGAQLQIACTLGGSVEAVPKFKTGVDAVIDVVQSGDTLRDNRMKIVIDDLSKICLGAVSLKPDSAGVPINPNMPNRFREGALCDAIGRIELRVDQSKAGRRESYTQQLVADREFLVSKIAEESEEAQRAYLSETLDRLENESADVMYFLSVALAARGSSLIKALNVLSKRGEE